MGRLNRVTLVIDAMCVIALDECSCLEKLRFVGATVAVVPEVASQAGLELRDGFPRDKRYDFIRVQSPKRERVPLLEQLDRGERESAGLCLEDPKWRFLVTEDRVARKKTTPLGIHIFGTEALLWILAVHGRITMTDLRRVLQRVQAPKVDADFSDEIVKP